MFDAAFLRGSHYFSSRFVFATLLLLYMLIISSTHYAFHYAGRRHYDAAAFICFRFFADIAYAAATPQTYMLMLLPLSLLLFCDILFSLPR